MYLYNPLKNIYFNDYELNSRDFSHEMKTTFIKILYLLFYVFLKIAHNKYE